MSKSGPIIIVEDDADDESLLEEILKNLGVENEIIWFLNGPETFKFLKSTTRQPFIIFCDVNLPLQNGIEFKRDIDADPQLRNKSIPFVFYTTFADQQMVNEAYTQMTVQGFFQKNHSYEEITKVISTIINYWRYCIHPNTTG